MTVRALLLAILLLASGQAFAQCDSMSWKFGMSPDEVAAVAECGPYRTFSNGDLETYAGVFNGSRENFQFFFREGKLWRIGIYLHESQDPDAAAKEWLDLYQVLAEMFGEVETPGNAAPQDAAAQAGFTSTALAAVRDSDKTQMAPLKQPSDAFVFSSFIRQEIGRENYYYVVLYFDARH